MVGFVIVSYHSDDATVDFINRELTKISLPCNIVVVANGSSEEEAAALKERIPQADVLAAPNKGYAVGNNLGFNYLMEHYNPSVVFFSNNDIHFVSGNVVEVMSETLAAHHEAGAVGPEIVGLDGERQSPEPYLGMWRRYVWMYLITPFVSKERKRKLFHLDAPSEATEGAYYKLSGSFFAVDPQAFRDAGMFDEHTFLYAEENILSDRMSRVGKCCWFVPSVRVLHEHGKTISKSHGETQRAWLQWKSMKYYYCAYRNTSKIGATIVGIIFRLILQLKRI